MRAHRFSAVLACLVLAGCSAGPDIYAPPVQRQPLVPSQPSYIGSFVRMSDPNADAYIVADVSDAVEAGTWRWARRRPELRFYVATAERIRFVMEFAVAGATFEETGPVTLAVRINGAPAHAARYDKPGEYKMEVPVPPGLLKPAAINTVVIEPDKVWVSKQDGVALGFILTAAGFLD